MARDLNPNKVTRKEVDPVFIATAGEVIDRKHKAKTAKHLVPAQRRLKLQQAEEIVEKAKQKKEKNK